MTLIFVWNLELILKFQLLNTYHLILKINLRNDIETFYGLQIYAWQSVRYLLFNSLSCSVCVLILLFLYCSDI